MKPFQCQCIDIEINPELGIPKNYVLTFVFVCVREQTPLEEGEIPWLMYNEDSGTSSDEEADGVSHFVHPGLFILDGNNNLEDDSSVSEDLDTEWRLTIF